MKILHLLSTDRYSGAENVACQIISLFKDENEVVYCSPDGEIKNTLQDKNITFLPLQKMSLKEIKKAINTFQPEIVHAHDPRAIVLSSLVKGNFKIIAHMHSNRPDFKKFSLYSILFNMVTKKKKIRNVFWVSNSCLTDYKFNKNIINKSFVLNNIINQNEIIYKSEIAQHQDKTDIVFLGRLAFPKNPQRLIQIINQLVKLKPDVKVAIIGDGDLKNECQELVKSLNLQNNIKFYGFLSNGFGLLRNSKIFLMSSRFEGNPMCILEAQTLGLPIVAPQIKELKTTVIENETGFLYNSDEECVNILLKLLKDENFYNKLKTSTREFSKKYNDLEKYKNNIQQIYN